MTEKKEMEDLAVAVSKKNARLVKWLVQSKNLDPDLLEQIQTGSDDEA